MARQTEDLVVVDTLFALLLSCLFICLSHFSRPFKAHRSSRKMYWALNGCIYLVGLIGGLATWLRKDVYMATCFGRTVALLSVLSYEIIYLLYRLRNASNVNFPIAISRSQVTISLNAVVFWILLLSQAILLAVGIWALASREIQYVFSAAACSHLNFFIVAVQILFTPYRHQDGEQSQNIAVERYYTRLSYTWPAIGLSSLLASLLLLGLEATGKKTYLPASWQCLIIFIKILLIWSTSCKKDERTLSEPRLNAEAQQEDDTESAQGGADADIPASIPVETRIVV